MIDGREPNYICLDTRALTLARRLPDSERLIFFDGICAAYTEKLSGTESSAFPDNMTGDLIRQAAATMIDGFDKYMGRVHANPSGKKRFDNPMGSQWVANGTQSNQDQINQDHNNQDQINQIKAHLMAEGYSEAEIDNALRKCGGKTVRNLSAYLRQTIDNQRRQGKHVSVQDFQQRDYSGVNEEIMEQTARDIEQFKIEQEEAGIE